MKKSYFIFGMMTLFVSCNTWTADYHTHPLTHDEMVKDNLNKVDALQAQILEDLRRSFSPEAQAHFEQHIRNQQRAREQERQRELQNQR